MVSYIYVYGFFFFFSSSYFFLSFFFFPSFFSFFLFSPPQDKWTKAACNRLLQLTLNKALICMTTEIKVRVVLPQGLMENVGEVMKERGE